MRTHLQFCTSLLLLKQKNLFAHGDLHLIFLHIQLWPVWIAGPEMTNIVLYISPIHMSAFPYAPDSDVSNELNIMKSRRGAQGTAPSPRAAIPPHAGRGAVFPFRPGALAFAAAAGLRVPPGTHRAARGTAARASARPGTRRSRCWWSGRFVPPLLPRQGL